MRYCPFAANRPHAHRGRATLHMPGGNSVSVMFSSTLMSTGNVVAGNFSGSAVAVVTII
ncbi:hypothetical protein [Serratia plymuthica]|uniref:MrpH family fimbial adhesin n=1 Tax=Serratia plymuthica TaxID=82996 RepID=UPI003B75B85B